MVHYLTILFPSRLGRDIADQEGFRKRLLECCPALTFFEARDLPKRLREQHFYDGLLAVKDAGGDVFAQHRFKVEFQSVPKEPEPSSEQDRQIMRDAIWRWSRSTGGGVPPHDSLVGPYDACFNFHGHMIEVSCSPPFDTSKLADFYPRHLDLARQLARMIGVTQAIFLPHSRYAEFDVTPEIEKEFDSFKAWVDQNGGPRWERLEEIKRDLYDFEGYYLETFPTGSK